MKSFCLLLAALLLIGCAASLADIRQTEPLYSLASDKNPKELANCIAYESQEGALGFWNRYWDPVNVTNIGDNFNIIIPFSTGVFTDKYPMAEIIIIPNSNGGSRIEYRTVSRWNGKEKFWELVKKCAGHEQTSQNIP